MPGTLVTGAGENIAHLHNERFSFIHYDVTQACFGKRPGIGI